MGRIARLVLLSALAGCHGSAASSSSAPPPSPSSAETAGAEAISATAPSEPEARAEAEEPANGPAKLTVIAKVGNAKVAAHVKVFAADGSVVAEGASGEPLSVQSGDLEVEAQVTDKQALIDEPSMREGVTLAAGEDSTHTMSFARCQVRVTVNVKGKLDPTAVVTLSRQGKDVVKLTSGAPEYVSITPGRYSASVTSKRAQISVSELVLNEGATQSIPINAD